jgi:hypothetical protein
LKDLEARAILPFAPSGQRESTVNRPRFVECKPVVGRMKENVRPMRARCWTYQRGREAVSRSDMEAAVRLR